MNKWLSLITIPFQMGLIIFLGVTLGKYIYRRYSLSLLSIGISLYNFINQVNNIQKNKKND